MEEKYFAAVNSKNGFLSYYQDFFGEAERVYIIKGGPGTGKSYFMRKIADEAERRGRNVVYIYCSSDPNSLDGILIDGRLAFFDGTAPHAAEASCPGARDELIDLGQFWRSDALAAHRKEIERLSREKSLCYARAYDCLAAVGNIDRAISRLISPALLDEKMQSAAARYLRPLPSESRYREKNLAVNSTGMRGTVRFSTLEERAKSTVRVNDIFGTGHMFLGAVRKEAERRRISLRISHDPTVPEKADAIEFPTVSLLFTTADTDAGRIVNMRRFLDEKRLRECRAEYRMLAACKKDAFRAAQSELKEAAKYHFALESIYISCMDFEAKDAFSEDFAKALFS